MGYGKLRGDENDLSAKIARCGRESRDVSCRGHLRISGAAMALDYAVSASAWPKPRWERPDISRDAAVQRDIRDLQHDEGTDPLSDAPGYLGALMGYGKL